MSDPSRRGLFGLFAGAAVLQFVPSPALKAVAPYPKAAAPLLASKFSRDEIAAFDAALDGFNRVGGLIWRPMPHVTA